ncbi:HDOD domain-containing protein [Algibacillus agarilyticus]|uniref:HDOD domain-containing protein n=1 Tax=Algibacillus agarilyticus TaxID=2234133 RepID=UPI000DCFA568|nr:HDOD domain-containing protein [Algibacillus agarilyticus]
MIDIDANVINDIHQNFRIPARPDILEALNKLLNQSEPSLTDIGDLIAQDVATSAAILQTINSPFYGLARSISDIKQAVMFLGLEGIASLVTAIQLKKAFKQNESCISLERFWDSAAEVAQVATFIAQKFKHRVSTESIYTLGLFQDCGIPAMACNYSDYKRTLVEANKSYERTPTEIEDSVYNTNHAVIGYYLASAWNLPKETCQLILRSHEVKFLQSKISEEDAISYAAIKMAENLINTSKRFIASPDWPHIKELVLEVLDIDEDEYQDMKDDIDDLLN